jgi:hypothetical protein
LRVWAAAGVATLLLVGCSNLGPNAQSSSSPGSSPAGSNPTTTKAADLRARLDLLLAEQVALVAKESAAAAFETDEYPAYVALLAANTADLSQIVRQAFGNTSAAQFDQVWQQQNRDLVEYGVGLVTHKQSVADTASADLMTAFVPLFAQELRALTQLPLDRLTQLVTQQVTGIRVLVEVIAVQNFQATYSDLQATYAQTMQLGDALAERIVKMFPDKFPGDPTLQAVSLRVSLSDSLQEHAYLATMATDAVFNGRNTEKPAVTSALAANAGSLRAAVAGLFGSAAAALFDQLWTARDKALLDYAAATGTPAKVGIVSWSQSFVPRFASLARISPSPVSDQVDAAIKVIDDQRLKNFTALAADDRAAAAGMEPIADAMAAAGSTQG